MSTFVLAFYKFVAISEAEALRDKLHAFCDAQRIQGTILLAGEGINATVSGSRDALTTLVEILATETCVGALDCKWSMASSPPFKRLKVRIKPEIVTFGAKDADPSVQTGIHVKAENWNALIREPGVVVIDTRNDYEISVGTFEGAIDPATKSFSDFIDFVDRELSPDTAPKIAMFCTGGIRCEKASAFMLRQGYKEVYQLEGGILRYLETVPREQSLFQGECFVFDERVALEHGVKEGTHQHCPECGFPTPVRAGHDRCIKCQGANTDAAGSDQSSRKSRVATG